VARGDDAEMDCVLTPGGDESAFTREGRQRTGPGEVGGSVGVSGEVMRFRGPGRIIDSVLVPGAASCREMTGDFDTRAVDGTVTGFSCTSICLAARGDSRSSPFTDVTATLVVYSKLGNSCAMICGRGSSKRGGVSGLMIMSSCLIARPGASGAELSTLLIRIWLNVRSNVEYAHDFPIRLLWA
jgi:hypothetical protein